MEIANIIFLVAGLMALFFGIGAIFYPALARWIKAPGGPRLKSIIAIIAGVILVIISFIVEFPTN